MKTAGKNITIYPIRYVSQRTELSTHLIRVWEKRYKAVVPKRTDSNRRLFSEADVKRLQLLKQAVESGHSISQILELSSEALMRLRNGNSPEAGSDQVKTQKPHDAAYFLDLSFSNVTGLNADSLESALDQAAVHLTKAELINSVIVPLCKKNRKVMETGGAENYL